MIKENEFFSWLIQRGLVTPQFIALLGFSFVVGFSAGLTFWFALAVWSL